LELKLVPIIRSSLVAREDMKERIFYFLILFFVSRAGATELYEYNVSTRAHGMGGVYAPFPDETDAIFVNPAYLSQVHEIGWDLANAQAGISIVIGRFRNQLLLFLVWKKSLGRRQWAVFCGISIFWLCYLR
jgi:hypothetical protein